METTLNLQFKSTQNVIHDSGTIYIYFNASDTWFLTKSCCLYEFMVSGCI